MCQTDPTERLFEGRPKALRLFRLIENHIRKLGPVKVKATKTQVSFSRNRGFAWVWLPQMWVKAPQDSITLAFALSRRVEHPRIKDAVEPYPGRWTNHTIIEEETQIDKTLIDWLREAYDR